MGDLVSKFASNADSLGFMLGMAPTGYKLIDGIGGALSPAVADKGLGAQIKYVVDTSIPGLRRPLSNLKESLGTEASDGLKMGLGIQLGNALIKKVGLSLPADKEKVLTDFAWGLTLGGGVNAMVDPVEPSHVAVKPIKPNGDSRWYA